MNLDTLNAIVAIVDDQGRPTREFMVKWSQLRVVASSGIASAAQMSAALDLLGADSGDMLTRGSSLWQALALGAAGQVLTAGATEPEWANPPAAVLTTLMDAQFGSAEGMVLYRGASSWAALAPGTAGQVLTSGGGSANPSWATGGGGGSVNPPNPSGSFSYTGGGSGTSQTYAYNSAVGLSLKRTDTGAGGLTYTFMGQAKPTTSTWTVYAKIAPFEVGTPNFNAGLMVFDSATGKAAMIYAFNNASSCQTYHDFTTYGSNTVGPAGICNPSYIRTKVSFDGVTTFSFYLSFDDGLSYTLVGTASSLTDVNPTHVGVVMSCYGAVAAGCGALITQWSVGL